MTEWRFGNHEKASAARREVNQRKHVYARRVAEGKMTREKADREIRIMEEIERDYRELIDKDRLI